LSLPSDMPMEEIKEKIIEEIKYYEKKNSE
jgi:hypothetical protein